MSVIISIVLFAMLLAGISLYGYRRYVRPGRIYEQLGTPVISSQAVLLNVESGKPKESPMMRMLLRLGNKVPVSPENESATKKLLIIAGYRSHNAITIFYGIKIACVIGMSILMFLMVRDKLEAAPSMRIFFAMGGGMVGYILPSFGLGKRVKKRQTTLRLSLPDALDLMVVSVEAGLGLDQAIQHVCKELYDAHRELSEELNMMTLEMRAGKRRAEALRNLSDRTEEPEIRKLVAILIQNDRFGTSMAESLRTHSDFMRVRRRQDAEERAAKVGVKLVFPIFFFILPTMLLVSAGPAILQMIKVFTPLMKTPH
jgi:tight adherence protein C